jgi:hypothetical protein
VTPGQRIRREAVRFKVRVLRSTWCQITGRRLYWTLDEVIVFMGFRRSEIERDDDLVIAAPGPDWDPED